MSAVRKAAEKRAPTFSTSEYVDIDIDPEDLEAAGWVYVGTDDAEPPTATVLDTVKAWHDETHIPAWPWCQEEPCHSLNRRPPS